MSRIEPMLAHKLEPQELARLRYPLPATPKIDGIRCIRLGGRALSRSFKPIRSRKVREAVESLPDGLDGELVVTGSFQDVTSGIMSFDKDPDFCYKVFDFVHADPSTPYSSRVEILRSLALPSWVELLVPELVESERGLLSFEDRALSNDYEGIVVRDPLGPYKYGRSSLREGWMMKLRRQEDAEAVVVGFVEGMTNQNEAGTDAFGRMHRPGGQSMVFATGTLGSIQCIDSVNWPGVTLHLGSGPGMTKSFRQEVWDHQANYLGKVVKYGFQRIGSKDRPRHPRFLGFRSEDDASH